MDVDRIVASLRNVIRSIIFGEFNFGLWLGQAAKVVATQNPDGSTSVAVDIIPQMLNPAGVSKVPGVPALTADPTRAQMNAVPVLWGAAGVVSTPQQGSYVLYGFINGDPKQRYCMPWFGAAGVQQIVLNEGTKYNARKDDPVASGKLAITGAGLIVTFTYTNQDGTTQVTTMTLSGPGVGVAVTGAPEFDITGRITDGNHTVLS